MNITLQNISKKYGNHWIFRGISLDLKSQEKIVLLGANGSGKSTLLQIISGYITPNEGGIFFSENEKHIEKDNIHQ